MAKIDLNIVDRSTSGTDWVADNTSISADKLSEVVEQKTDNAGALNSLPTPFARFYVTREAFRRVTEEVRNPKNEAGFAYRQIVSDCLDVLELLFNKKFHDNSWQSSQKIIIKEWDRKEKMEDLKKSVPTLYNSLNTYFNSDLKEDKLYFVIYYEEGKEYLLACSSPMTLFVTPPDMDKRIKKDKGVPTYKFEGEQYQRLHITSKSGREYFRDPKLFGDRDADFKNYLYNEIFGGSNIDSRFKEMQEYIKCFKNDSDIRSDYDVETLPVMTEDHDELVINGLSIGYDKAVDVNSFFTPSIIKVPYRLSEEDVKIFPTIKGDPNRDFDFLLPFKPAVLQLFGGVPDCSCHIKNPDYVVVTLNYKGKQYTKEYEQDPIRETDGKIEDMALAKQNFDLGLFPNILSTNDNENNYFKILLALSDNDEEAPQLSVDGVSLSFYKIVDGKLKRIQEADSDSEFEYGVKKPVVRTHINTPQDRRYIKYESKFYELFNSSFDAIDLDLMGSHGLIIPNWRHASNSKQVYKYAIDLGTSNTFIARCEDGQNKQPELFSMSEPMVSYLHTRSDNEQMGLANRIEESIFESGKDAFLTEFAPAIIDNKKYSFPIRTVLCHVKNNTDKPVLFDNHNIAFFYEKNLETAKQEVITDIKWDNNEDRIRVFVRELLLMIKADVLQRNGDLDCTEIVWFRPLTFPANVSGMYERIWKEEPKSILDIDSDKVKCYTESEAPYYYFKKKNDIPNSQAVTVIDIGGGSTDFVYFKDNQPQLANSVHFGCDVLWDNGTAEFDNMRDNGIFNRYVNTIQFQNSKLKEIFDGLVTDKNSKTRDIINFWLDNAKDCDIIQSLNADFKPVFVYHFISILYYMASMYKDNNLECPKTVVFSGNGSKYIDNFISAKDDVLKRIIDFVFGKVYGEKSDVHLRLPNERKESTCYGGLYRQEDEPSAPEYIYQGNQNKQYNNVGEIVTDYKDLKSALLKKYDEMADIYKEVLGQMKHDRIIDNSVNITVYINEVKKDMSERLDTNFTKEVKQKYSSEDIYFDSVFFLPIVDKVFELTKI